MVASESMNKRNDGSVNQEFLKKQEEILKEHPELKIPIGNVIVVTSNNTDDYIQSLYIGMRRRMPEGEVPQDDGRHTYLLFDYLNLQHLNEPEYYEGGIAAFPVGRKVPCAGDASAVRSLLKITAASEYGKSIFRLYWIDSTDGKMHSEDVILDELMKMSKEDRDAFLAEISLTPEEIAVAQEVIIKNWMREEIKRLRDSATRSNRKADIYERLL